MDRRKTSREWAHGLTALVLGLFLLGVSSGTGILKTIVDFWGNLLFIPEYPAVIFRESFNQWRENSRSSEELNNELSKLRSENIQLRLELSQLKSEKIFSDSQSETVSNDNETEIESSGYIPKNNVAKITLRAPMSWWNEIRIDKGERDGITTGLPIFHNGYLIGRISTVSYMSSWAELITSQSFMIPAVIEETRELGVVVGDGNGAVLLEYIPAGRTLTKGMKVSTAMISEQLPPGLPIGQIIGDAVSGADGYSTYRVEPGADMSG